MLPTPDTSHVSYDTIYEPAEDSFLLLDTLSNESEKTWLRSRLCPPCPLAVEIGTGSGVVISFLSANAEVIVGRSILALGVDVNMNACKASKVTAERALLEQQSGSLYLASACADLVSVLKSESVDILIFNPPYVPTESLPSLPNHFKAVDEYERNSHLLSLSYAGGEHGMETTHRLLKQIPYLLSKQGVAYILLCRQNMPAEIKAQISEWPNGPWHAETVGSSGKQAGWEKLEIVRIWK